MHPTFRCDALFGYTVFRRCSEAQFLPGLWIQIGSGFNDFVDPDPDWESGSRIRIQGQENEEK
jgi:hypothetical protein